MANLEDIPVEDYEVLHENSAQDIFNILRELESDRESHEKRWPWELVQNAADAARPSGVDCVFRASKEELVFTHNGRSFTRKEVSHLILHGSTKTDESERVRFGTGFITTHLLSRKVHVRGLLDEGTRFDFDLDRTASKWPELETLMYRASKDFRNSLKPQMKTGEVTDTEFRYQISDSNLNTAITGLGALRDNIHLVLALNKKLNSVRIIDSISDVTWTRVDDEIQDLESVRIIPVNGLSNTTVEDHGLVRNYSVALNLNGKVSVAILLQGKSPNFEIASMERVPKLYYEFPLATTETFPSPAVIISPVFVPRNQRDGLLWGKDEGFANSANKTLVEKGYDLLFPLAKIASKNHWGNLHRLAEINSEFAREGLDSEWLNRICLSFISKIRSLELLEGIPTSESPSRYLKPEESVIPYSSDIKTLTTIWGLADSLFHEKLPSDSHAHDWAKILTSWSKFLGKKAEEMEESLTVPKLATHVSKIGSLSALGKELRPKPSPELTDTITWFNAFLDLTESVDASLVQTLTLIPDQTTIGQFRKAGIYKDPGISDLLKDIMDLLGDSLRAKLADQRISKSVLVALTPYSEDDVVKDAINLLKKKAEDITQYRLPAYEKANVAFFYWLTQGKKFSFLRDNFPVLSYEKDLKEPAYISHILADQPLLKPVSLWDEKAKRHAVVFPGEKILSESYTTEVLATGKKMDDQSWTALATEKIVFQNLFVSEVDRPNEEMIHNLLVEGKLNDEDHSATQPISLGSIAFIDLADRGIHAVRKSKPRTLEFLDFILSYVISRDDSWSKSVSIPCSCKDGSHKIYPSKWLFLMKHIEWVYLRKDKEDHPTDENLAQYFESGSPLLSLLNEDLPSKFLNVLGISTPQLMLASQSPAARYEINKFLTSILLATNNNPAELQKISRIMQNPTLRGRIDDAYQQQKDLERNRTIGKIVEDKIRELLGSSLPTDKFKVSKVPDIIGGSDVEVDVDPEFDLLDDELQPEKLAIEVEGNKLFIEVKSTRRDFVRITIPQAKAAIGSPKSHLVCVVEIPHDFDALQGIEQVKLVRQNAIFLLNIGSQVTQRFDKALRFQDLEKEIKQAPQDEIMVEVVRGSQLRVRLSRDTWTGGKFPSIKFDKLVEFLRGSM